MYEIMSGVKVVEVASWTFVPAASAILADWGADVVKVEHPETGDPQRGLFNLLTSENGANPMLEVPNRGKRSIGLDISTPEGLQVLHELVKNADVFVTSFLDAQRVKLKIDVEDLRAVNPDLIYARGTGWGPRGPEADRGGFDLASTWARGGIAYLMTPEDGEPPMMPGSVGDLSGGVTLAGAIAAALFHRERTGRAEVVDVSLYGVGMWLMSQSITGAPLGLSLPRGPKRTDSFNPLVNPYRTKDNRWLYLVFLQADRWWPELAKHLGRADLAADERFADSMSRMTNAAELIAELDATFATNTLAEWRDTLGGIEGVWAPAMSPEEIGTDPQVLENEFFPEIHMDNGNSFRIVACPMQFGATGPGELRQMPEHGQHTEEVLLELGRTWEDIVGYKDAGVIV